MPFPRVVVLDLDGTIWTPEMYELWGGGGAPFTRKANDVLVDRKGTRVRLYDGVATAIVESKRNGAVLGVASTTDEPEWARECMAKFAIEQESGKTTPLHTLFEHIEIYKANKRTHLARIKERAGVEFKDILFIDNEMGNIRNVSSLGVMCYYASEGLTQEGWLRAIERFQSGTL